jgi:Planctomycete extracellular
MPEHQPPSRVAARRVTPRRVVHAEVFTLGKRRAFMEQLEARRVLADAQNTKNERQAS